MKKLVSLFMLAAMIACNNSKKENPLQPSNTTRIENPASHVPATGAASVTFTVDGAEISNRASALVSKDKKNLQADAPYMCILTSNAAAHNDEYLNLNFLLDTKPGTYPVVGMYFKRGKDGDDGNNNQMFGGILGGDEKLTGFKVNITECRDLGANSSGGHRWSISGNCEEVVIKAMGIMLYDKTKNHPQEIKLEKISFSNITFEDNWDEMMEKMKEKFNEMKKN